MATTNTCDGTGVPIPADTPTTGLFGKQYCDEVRHFAEAYLAAVDEAHTEAAELFASKLAVLRATYGERLRELPDSV